MCAQHERLKSLRTTAIEQGLPNPNCIGLHKALADGMPERRGKEELREIHHKVDETTTKCKAFAI